MRRYRGIYRLCPDIGAILPLGVVLALVWCGSAAADPYDPYTGPWHPGRPDVAAGAPYAARPLVGEFGGLPRGLRPPYGWYLARPDVRAWRDRQRMRHPGQPPAGLAPTPQVQQDEGRLDVPGLSWSDLPDDRCPCR